MSTRWKAAMIGAGIPALLFAWLAVLWLLMLGLKSIGIGFFPGVFVALAVGLAPVAGFAGWFLWAPLDLRR